MRRVEPIRVAFMASSAVHLAAAIGFFLHLNKASDYTPPQILQIQLIHAAPAIRARPIADVATPEVVSKGSPKQGQSPHAVPLKQASTLTIPLSPESSVPHSSSSGSGMDRGTPAVKASAQNSTGSGVVAPRFDAAYLNNPAPEYPAVARRRKQEGTTFLNVVVDTAGKPVTIEISLSSGSPELDRAAQEAVKSWSFIPAKQDGKSVEGRVEVPIRFRLTVP